MSGQEPMAYVPSPMEVQAGMTPAGGFTRVTLEQWGVPWPPPKGWRAVLEQQWRAQQSRSE